MVYAKLMASDEKDAFEILLKYIQWINFFFTLFIYIYLYLTFEEDMLEEAHLNFHREQDTHNVHEDLNEVDHDHDE